MATSFYIDIAPLQEFELTGIPLVTAKLCEQMLGDAEIEPRFFYNRHEIPTTLIEKVLVQRNGAILRWAAGRYLFQPILASLGDDPVWGLHTNIKFTRRLFPVEGCIVHDLTTVVTPQHHTHETNVYHQSKFYGDLMSSDVIFTVSQSTAADVRTYYPEAADIPVVVAHLGVDWSHIPEDLQAFDAPVEDFILVLGTLEPRKNVGAMLDLLEREPALAERFRIIFGGRVGWGDAFERQLAKRGLTALAEAGRILQTGFISESAKYLLCKTASAVIYPSVYEGFGLPVAEAISLGAPVVTTASSSLPEVGRGLAEYFVAGDTDSLSIALHAALGRGRGRLSASGETLEDWRRYFSWPRCYRAVKDGFTRVSQLGRC